MYKIFKMSLLVGVFLFVNTLMAQNSLRYTEEDYNYRLGVELFEKEKYAQAQEIFKTVIDYYGTEHTDVKADAEYLSALCAIELFNDDAEYRIAQFIAKYPESPRTRVAYYEMGRFQYRNRKYDEALFYFDKVWKQNLSREQLNEFYFKKGYAYFKEDAPKKAAKMFYEVINKDSKYQAPALYYYSHLAYNNENYETALKGFKKLEENKTFAPVVPYYVIQIYFMQGKTEEVLELGPKLLELKKTKREAEISRIVGEALFQNEQYAEALPYLETYKQKGDNYTRADMYQLGYLYYMLDDYQNAVSTLSNVTNVDDELSQNAFFHMADSYLQLGKKEQARMAFEASSKGNFDGEVKEISLLNYAKLSYELSYSPFNETITAFYNYITNYPNSVHHDEAYSYLVKVYMTSKNYREALASINKIKVKTPEMVAAHQRVAYYRGLELFNNLQFEGALAAFTISLQQRAYDRSMRSMALYWKGEALYRMDDYAKAAQVFDEFLVTPGAYLLKEYNNAYYNQGYCYFKLKDYGKSVIWFRKYIEENKNISAVKRGDALIRIADGYFMIRDYNQAALYYDKAVNLAAYDVDYAMFQQGFSYGLLKDYDRKISTLTALLNKNSASAYAADALYERGRSFVETDELNPALNDFELLMSTHPNSSYVVKALLNLGLLNYGLDNYDKALKAYKQVVNDYPGTNEANDAMLGIKNIYVDMNQVDKYIAFVNNNGNLGDISLAEQDSLTYLAAEKVYMSAKWDMAQKMFNDYIGKFSNGRFALSAHYYRADCYMRNNLEDSAYVDFLQVIDRPKNMFTENSLLNAALIAHNKGLDTTAFNLYKQLENQAEVKSNLLIARKGQMQTAFSDSNYTAAIESARRFLITDKIAEEEIREARLVIGKSFFAQQIFDPAITEFRILALDVKSAEGSEGKYRVAEILYMQNDIAKAEEEILDFIGQGTPHQYWLAKAFLLLSDIYLKKDDAFQAKANLQSVIDNYGVSDDGIIDEAKALLDNIVSGENKVFEKSGQEELDLIEKTEIE